MSCAGHAMPAFITQIKMSATSQLASAFLMADPMDDLRQASADVSGVEALSPANALPLPAPEGKESQP